MARQKFPFSEPEPILTTAQLAGDSKPDRTDHVWFKDGSRWKCCICGAVTLTTLPDHPTPKGWNPHTYDKLTESDRRICPQRFK